MKFGLRWEFTPYAEWPQLIRPSISFVSLRLETFLKYGGPLEEFRTNLLSAVQLQYFSDYLPVAGTWDPVHQLASQDFLREGFVTCRAAVPEVPSPDNIIRDLLSSLPKGVEAAVLVRNREEVNRVRDLNGIFVAISARDWLGDPNEVSHFADRVLEIEVETELIRSGYDTVEKIIGEVALAKSARGFSVTLVLPAVVSEQTYRLIDDFIVRIKKDLDV
jgi:hypothetical protein